MNKYYQCREYLSLIFIIEDSIPACPTHTHTHTKPPVNDRENYANREVFEYIFWKPHVPSNGIMGSLLTWNPRISWRYGTKGFKYRALNSTPHFVKRCKHFWRSMKKNPSPFDVLRVVNNWCFKGGFSWRANFLLGINAGRGTIDPLCVYRVVVRGEESE